MSLTINPTASANYVAPATAATRPVETPEQARKVRTIEGPAAGLGDYLAQVTADILKIRTAALN